MRTRGEITTSSTYCIELFFVWQACYITSKFNSTDQRVTRQESPPPPPHRTHTVEVRGPASTVSHQRGDSQHATGDQICETWRGILSLSLGAGRRHQGLKSRIFSAKHLHHVTPDHMYVGTNVFEDKTEPLPLPSEVLSLNLLLIL